MNMFIGQEFNVIGDWFIIHFTENNGMAFGLEFAGQYGKLFLSLFRICAVMGIAYGMHYLIKNNYPRGFIFSISLILAGAIGNIIDSTFYGIIFDYETLFYGRVVDMFYFPVIQGYYPQWVPFWGGNEFIFFRPVFNLADASISSGVIVILLFQKKYFSENYTTSLHGDQDKPEEKTNPLIYSETASDVTDRH